MDSFEENLKQEFLTEAREMLEDVESRFLELERNPSDKSIMDHIFRLAHTVKGSAFAAGFDGLGSFAHTFETLLNLLRDGKMEATDQIVDLLLRSNDTLSRFVDALIDDHNAIFDVEDISQELIEAIGDDGQKKWDGSAFGFFDDEPTAVASPQKDKEAGVAPQNVSSSAQVSAAPKLVQVPFEVRSNVVAKPNADSIGEVQLGSVQNPRILICDDEPEIIELASDLLRQMYPVMTFLSANDGVEALSIIKEQKPHLIVTDLKMPNLNGIDFVRKVRNFDDNVPVIFFSGYADRNNMIEFIKLGVVDFHDKPLDIDRFGLSIANALKMVQTREGIIKLSTLNFKAYMSTLKLSQLKLDQKAEAEQLSQKVKAILDEVAITSNYIMGL